MGYIILDPATGAGAYKISGGANGGAVQDDELGLSFHIDPASSSSSAGLSVALVGGVVNAASKSPVAAQMLSGMLRAVAPEVSAAILASGGLLLGIAIVILALVVLLMWIESRKAEAEDIRQEVISNARTNPLAADLPENNCIAYGSNVFMVPSGWVRCLYKCQLSAPPFVLLQRFLPFEVGCPSPVPCAPGIYPLLETPPPRSVGDPIPPRALMCTFG